MAGTILFSVRIFMTMDNTKSSKHMKEKVKWLTPGKICGLWTATVIQQEMTLRLWIKRKVMKRLVLSHCYKKGGHPLEVFPECSGAQVAHSPSLLGASEDDGDGDDDDGSEHSRLH
jgi:hypothetical protein